MLVTPVRCGIIVSIEVYAYLARLKRQAEGADSPPTLKSTRVEYAELTLACIVARL